MKFTIGDNIILKRTGEEGIVSGFINAQMIEVEVGGTSFPVYIEEVDHPYLKWFTDKNNNKKKQPAAPAPVPAEKLTVRQQRLAQGVYLSFLPVFKTEEMDEVVSHVKVFLLNELPVSIRFVYDARIVDNTLFRHEGTLHAFGNIYLHSVAYADMNDQPRLHWTLTDIAHTENKEEEGVLRIKPAKLFDHINRILQGAEPSFSYLLIDGFVVKPPPQPAPAPVPIIRSGKIVAAKKHEIEAPKYELDLHIEQLVNNPRGLATAEILKIQLDTLQRYLQIAIVHRQHSMVIIHGLGKGKLRDEVHAELRMTPEVARFKNEWSGRYGFGATEVIFKY
jgi:hypothetical protein